MNAKLLFAATLALAVASSFVASSFAQAADNTLPLTRAAVAAEAQRTIADGTLLASDDAGGRQIVTTHAKAPAANRATARLAQRLKAAFSRDAS